ncbi:MAG: LicD family protein [archaeon]|nr:LicD family protein [archaeon]
MGLKGKISNFKNYYNVLKNSSKRIEKLEKQVKKQEMQISSMNETIDSYHILFNDLYLNFTHTPIELLQNIRELAYETLEFIDNVCEKHGLEYWLDYGTLLGAVRHGDFIPWDDDLDICMMRGDYNIMCDVLSKEIESHNLKNTFTVFKHNPKAKVPNYRWLQLRCKYPGYKTTLVGLDIFPFDYIKQYNEKTISDNFEKARKRFYKHNREGVKFDKVLNEYYDYLNLNLEKEDNYIPGVECVHGVINRYKLEVRKTDELFPLKRINFGEKMFLSPNNHDYHLKSIYGKNYLQIPKNVRNHGRIGRLKRIDNIMDKYDESIKLFKLANENF